MKLLHFPWKRLSEFPEPNRCNDAAATGVSCYPGSRAVNCALQPHSSLSFFLSLKRNPLYKPEEIVPKQNGRNLACQVLKWRWFYKRAIVGNYFHHEHLNDPKMTQNLAEVYQESQEPRAHRLAFVGSVQEPRAESLRFGIVLGCKSHGLGCTEFRACVGSGLQMHGFGLSSCGLEERNQS